MLKSLFGWLLSRPQDEQKRPAKKRRRAITLIVITAHVLGVLTSVDAVMSTRTSQGAIAWAIGANSFPWLFVPAYWVFGQSRFDGYEMLRLSEALADDEIEAQAKRKLDDKNVIFKPETPAGRSHVRLLEKISKLPVTASNQAELLVDGEETFDAILAGIAEAQDYVLVQFYIVRDDQLGGELKDALIARAREGVRVYFQYDELGSKDLSDKYISDLKEAGVEIEPFNTTKGRGNRFRLNFRNHRKVVVVDGKIAYVGGSNVGDEYMGKHPTLSPWRDTHVQLQGPIVQCVQAPFAEDWKWATGQVPDMNWDPSPVENSNVAAACIPTGPADRLETGSLWFLHAINSAQSRLWIASPYFIPDEQIMSALQLAALRGVDVRIIIPKNPDHLHVYLSGLSYLEEAKEAGVQIFRYKPGFMHQKVMLIDDYASVIGTANLDNRSMRLNFEITMLLIDSEFARKVEAMLEKDLSNSELASATDYTDASLPFRFLVRVCRLLAPVQ